MTCPQKSTNPLATAERLGFHLVDLNVVQTLWPELALLVKIRTKPVRKQCTLVKRRGRGVGGGEVPTSQAHLVYGQ